MKTMYIKNYQNKLSEGDNNVMPKDIIFSYSALIV